MRTAIDTRLETGSIGKDHYVRVKQKEIPELHAGHLSGTAQNWPARKRTAFCLISGLQVLDILPSELAQSAADAYEY